MENSQTEILRASHLEVDLDALTANLETFKRHVTPAKVMCVVKANAYGHGLVECAKKLEKIGADYFGVALLQEGIELRQAGIKSPIHVFSGILEDEVEYFIKNDLDLTASSIDKMKSIEQTAKQLGKKARVHLKIDTGLGRIGTRIDKMEQLHNAAMSSEHCVVAGVFSHMAKADEADPSFTQMQRQEFLNSLTFFEKSGNPMPLRHIANSAAAIGFKECHLDMVRIGLALYGIYPAEHLKTSAIELVPALSLKSKIVFFKVVKEGGGVSYTHTWVAPANTRVVTIPIGYGDGYSRSMSNCAHVLIRGKRYPVVGNVCMDQLMVDIGHDEAFNGEEVVLIGQQGYQQITVDELASAGGTVSHEILASLNARIPRIYMSKDKKDNSLNRSIA
jgi:alanine racemase